MNPEFATKSLLGLALHSVGRGRTLQERDYFILLHDSLCSRRSVMRRMVDIPTL